MVQKTASRRRAIRKRKDKSNEKVETFASTSSSTTGASIDQPQKRYMGVRQSPSGRWVAEIKGTSQKIRLWLGTFDTAEAAAHAYDEAACLLRGAKTRTNFWPHSLGCNGRPDAMSSTLPAKVFNHLLHHLETHVEKQPIKNQEEKELINRIDYSELVSDVSISSTNQENEFSMSYCNTEAICIQDQQKVKEEEEEEGVNFVDIHHRLEEELPCFYAPFEMSTMMEEAKRKEEMAPYEYCLMLSSAEKDV